jgi:aryl-alcohol dehydrogenase-like predicted oxidoreductase
LKLALGTVQFGLGYGIANTQGKTPRDEVVRILGLAKKEGIAVLDTAALYGSSEEVLGDCLPTSHGFRIVTKTPQFRKPQITPEDARHLRNTFTDSLQKLGQPRVYGLLVHHADDLLADGGEYLMDAMLELKAAGRVAKVGVSVYDGAQIDHLLDRYTIDLVQTPVSVFDQRLLSAGKLAALKNMGVEIHARSLFLQGLLLMPLERIADYFAPIKQHIRNYQAYLQEKQISLLQGALAFTSACKEIDVAVVGVASTGELRGILDAWHSLPQEPFDFSGFACNDEYMVNPALWQRS